jgi:hypothetical protein
MEELIGFIAEIIVDALISLWKSRRVRAPEQLILAPPMSAPKSRNRRRTKHHFSQK